MQKGDESSLLGVFVFHLPGGLRAAHAEGKPIWVEPGHDSSRIELAAADNQTVVPTLIRLGLTPLGLRRLATEVEIEGHIPGRFQTVHVGRRTPWMSQQG